MSNNEIVKEKSEPSLLWSIIKNISLALFPGIRLLKINQGLKRVSKFYSHEWFAKQRRRNLIVSLVVSLPFILSLMFSGLVILKADNFTGNMSYAQKALFNMEISKSFDYTAKAFGNKDTVERIGVVTKVMGFGMVVSFLLGTFVMISHPLIRDSKKLYQMLQKNGVIDKTESHRLVIATPLGFLIDITGNTAKEVKENERIWMALNLRVTDWSEDPNQRAICFFKKAYELKPSYTYKF